MALLRGPLVSLTALVVYVAANVAVRGMHHHPAEAPASRPAAPGSAAYDSQPSAPATDDCTGQDCPICGILYLAQDLPTAVAVLAVSRHCAGWVIPLAVSVPHAFPHLTHSRGPPAL